jgi:hypothetical protein
VLKLLIKSDAIDVVVMIVIYAWRLVRLHTKSESCHIYLLRILQIVVRPPWDTVNLHHIVNLWGLHNVYRLLR